MSQQQEEQVIDLTSESEEESIAQEPPRKRKHSADEPIIWLVHVYDPGCTGAVHAYAVPEKLFGDQLPPLELVLQHLREEESCPAAEELDICAEDYYSSKFEAFGIEKEQRWDFPQGKAYLFFSE